MALKSKVARLPFVIREEINERLLNGEQAPAIIPWVNAMPEAVAAGIRVNAQNLSVWRKTGYMTWLADRSKTERVKELAEHYMRMAAASGGNLSEGGIAIATGKLLEIIEAADADNLDGIVKALTAIRDRELAARAVAVREKTAEQQAKRISIEEARFRRQTAELFIQWCTDKAALEIATSKAAKEVKVSGLVKRIFGEKPADLT